MPDRIAALLVFLLRIATALPWRVLDALAGALAWLWQALDAREHWVARRNLELIEPDRPPGERALLARAVLRNTARQAIETLRIWTHPHARNLALVGDVHGAEHLDVAIAAGRGVIVVAPHHGNWELLNQWLATRAPIAVLYRAPESALGEAFLRRVRRDAAGRVTPVRADPTAIRALLRVLGGGGVVGILPDQQPKAGDGVFVPFFGVPALTMTLVGRLAARTGAAVVLAWCERTGRDPRGAPRFAIHVEPADAALADTDPLVATGALNAAIERIARRDPAQYQWTYKRFTLRPPGSGDDNPYRDLERAHGRR